jgi:C4-dicarboxylate-specific signal transduction histidine kinase
MRDAYEPPIDSECQIRVCRAVAAEVTQPLTAIGLQVAAARKWLAGAKPNVDRALASLAMIDATAQRANDIVRHMHEFAARANGRWTDVDLGETISTVLAQLDSQIAEQSIRVAYACQPQDVMIRADGAQLQELVTHVVTNAIEALATLKSKRRRRIGIVVTQQEHGTLEISVEDNGPGVLPEHADRIFNASFTTKAWRRGMGLTASQAIARIHGGSLGHEAVEPHGACFRLQLPVPGMQSST